MLSLCIFFYFTCTRPQFISVGGVCSGAAVVPRAASSSKKQGQLINQLSNQSINQSINQLINQSINQLNQSVKSLINQLINQGIQRQRIRSSVFFWDLNQIKTVHLN